MISLENILGNEFCCHVGLGPFFFFFLTQTGIIHEVRLVVKSPLWTASDKEETSKLLPSPEIHPLPEPQ